MAATVARGITTSVILDLSDIDASMAQMRAKFKQMEKMVGGVRLKIGDTEVKNFTERAMKPAVGGLTKMADMAKVAKSNIDTLNKAIKQLQASNLSSGLARQLGGVVKSDDMRKQIQEVYSMQTEAQTGIRGSGKGAIAVDQAAAQKTFNAARAQTISLLRQQIKEEEKLLATKTKEIEVSIKPAVKNALDRVMLDRKTQISALRKELNLLYVMQKKGLLTDEDRIRAYRIMNDLKAKGINITSRLVKLEQEAAAANAKQQQQRRGGGLGFMSRMKWFLQLRAFWGAYRLASDAIEAIMEKDEALARSLRTSRIGDQFRNRTEIVEAYGKAIEQMGVKYGAGFKETGEVLYQLGSAGLKSSESMAALDSTMQLLIGTEGDAREITKAVASIYNNFGDTMTNQITLTEKMTHINATLANTWRDHQVEISELTQGMAMSSQMAVRVGVKFEELSAMLGVLNTHMIKSGRAGRSLQNIFARISAAPVQFAKTFGVALDPSKPMNFMELMGKLNEKMKDGTMTVADIGDMFARLGLRGAPAFAALIKHWDEVGEAMKTNLEKGKEGLQELEEEMTTRFRGALNRFGGAMKILGLRLFEGVGDMAKDAMNFISDETEAMQERINLQGMFGKEQAAMRGSAVGRFLGIEDLDALKAAMDKFTPSMRTYYKEMWAWAVKRREELEKTAKLAAQFKKEDEASAQVAKQKADADKQAAEVAEVMVALRRENLMAEALSMDNAKEQLAEWTAMRDAQQVYYNELFKNLGKNATAHTVIVDQKKELVRLNQKVASVESYITQQLEKQRKALAAQQKKLSQAQAETAKTAMWMDNPRLSFYGRMQAEMKWLDTEKQLKQKAAQEELANVINSETAKYAEKERAFMVFKEKEKQIEMQFEQMKANMTYQINQQKAQDELNHKTSVWQGGGGMGGGMLGAHANFLAKQKAEKDAYDKWEASKTEEDRKRYEEAKEERIAGAVEVGRATVGAAADMMYQMAQKKKKYFKYYQMLSIAETVIATGQGVMQAYAQAGPYLGSVFAALITAIGAMKVAMIMKQKPPEYAQGGVFDAQAQQRRNQGAAYATGGVTSTAAYAMLGDNASGKELVIPAEHINSDHTAGYTRNAGAPQIINVVTSEDVAAAMQQSSGQNTIVNAIGRDMRERRSTYRNVQDTAKGR